MSTTGIRRSLESRFWKKVLDRRRNGCWIWTGSKNDSGYGKIAAVGAERKMLLAHRVSYELNVGPIPEGFQVLHSCDVRNCVNPAHLWLGTNADNVADKVAKGRLRTAVGSACRRATIDEDTVRAIRQRLSSGERAYILAEEYGVSKYVISHIKRRNSWRHVT